MHEIRAGGPFPVPKSAPALADAGPWLAPALLGVSSRIGGVFNLVIITWASAREGCGPIRHLCLYGHSRVYVSKTYHSGHYSLLATGPSRCD